MQKVPLSKRIKKHSAWITLISSIFSILFCQFTNSPFWPFLIFLIPLFLWSFLVYIPPLMILKNETKDFKEFNEVMEKKGFFLVQEVHAAYDNLGRRPFRFGDQVLYINFHGDAVKWQYYQTEERSRRYDDNIEYVKLKDSIESYLIYNKINRKYYIYDIYG